MNKKKYQNKKVGQSSAYNSNGSHQRFHSYEPFLVQSESSQNLVSCIDRDTLNKFMMVQELEEAHKLQTQRREMIYNYQP